jgi:hypothetical protein
MTQRPGSRRELATPAAEAPGDRYSDGIAGARTMPSSAKADGDRVATVSS